MYIYTYCIQANHKSLDRQTKSWGCRSGRRLLIYIYIYIYVCIYIYICM